MKNLFPHLLGNGHTKKLMAEDIRKGTFLHACILEAVKGAGVEDVAFDIAAALACTRKDSGKLPCGACPSCRKIEGRTCVDVITVDKGDKATIGVDKIRAMKQDAVLTPSELDCKIYVLKEAERLTEEAQNALLKLLEEPPVENTYFILCTENAEALLPTVRSRAPVTRLTPPERDEVCRALTEERPVSREDALLAAAIAENGIALAREVLDGTDEGKRKTELYNHARRLTEMLAEKKSKTEIILYISSLSAKKEEATEILRLIYSGLRDIIAVKRCQDCTTDLYQTPEHVRRYAGKMTVRSAVRISDAVSEALVSLEKNASPKTVLLAFAVSAHNAVFG